MKNKIFELGDELKKQIEKFDRFVKNYNDVSQTSQIPSTAYMNWAVNLASEGNLEEAMDKLQTAALMPNKNPGIYINLGIALLKQRNFEEAIKNFRKAVKIDKFNSKAYAMWASALSEIGDLKGAVDIYKLAQKYEPRDPDIYLNWGISLAKAGRKREAEEKFKKSVSLNPINPATPFLWGLILLEDEKYAEAINKFNHSLIYAENKFDSLYYLSLCYIKNNDFKMAQEYALKALEADNTKVDPYIVLADCYLNTCQEKKCLNIFKEAEENAQTNSQFYLNWGLALQRYTHIDEAREKLYMALMIEPNNEIVLYNLGINFLISKELTQAQEFFNKVLDINPNHPHALFNLAAIAFNNSDFNSALELYKSSYENDRKNHYLFFNIANCYYKKGDMENARIYYKKCIEYCPKHIQAYMNYANMLVETGEEQEALRKARTAYLLDKDSPFTNFAFGIILLRLGKYDDSIEKFNNAIKLDTNSDIFSGKNETSQSLLNSALEYCNKFLEQYNNDKVLVIKNILLEKCRFEAN